MGAMQQGSFYRRYQGEMVRKGLIAVATIVAAIACACSTAVAATAGTGTILTPTTHTVLTATAAPGTILAPAEPAAATTSSTPPGECTLEWFNIKRIQKANSYYAQGLVGQYCAPGGNPSVAEQYSCGELDEFWLKDKEWHDMAYKCSAPAEVNQEDGTWTWAYPTVKCQDGSQREYRIMGDGWYKDSKGDVANAHTDWGYQYLFCRS